MTAEQLCEMTADIIGMSYPSDKDKMFFLCSMVNHEIWKQGRYDGTIKEFYVNLKDGLDGNKYIVTPNGYNILLGVNLDTKPTRITNSWFKFHRNGIGDAPHKTRFNLTESVMDLGKTAVIEQPRVRKTIQAGIQDPVYITVRSRGYEDESANMVISGENRLGQLVYSFKESDQKPITRSLTNPNETTVVKGDPTYGVDFKLTNKFSLCDNIHWSQVTKITKTVTNNPVDVYAVHDSGESYLLATLAPHQRESIYRTYQLPKEECSNHGCVLAMFKVSEPDRIEFGSQSMITSNPTALIDAMIGMDFKYFKKDLNAAATYILSAVKALEDSTRENMANTQQSIQVDQTIYATPEHYLEDQY